MQTLELKQPNDVDLSTILTRVNELIDQAGRVVVTNEEQRKLANDLLRMVKVAIKSADEERLTTTKPFRDGIDAINARYKNELTEPLKKAQKLIEAQLDPYDLEQLRKKRELEAQQKKALEQKALDDAAAAPTQEAAEEVLTTAVAAVERIPQASTVRGNYGSVTSTSIKYDYEIENEELIPREYCSPDGSKLRKAVNGDNRVLSIPGVKIVEAVKRQSR